MTERPILFSKPMVKAILAGQKSVTRRLLKPQPIQAIMDKEAWGALQALGGILPEVSEESRLGWTWKGTRAMPWPHTLRNFCPYGRPGDFLYVKEQHQAIWTTAEPPATSFREGGPGWRCVYAADGLEDVCDPDASTALDTHRKSRPSIYMPRWASRLLLEIVNVRAERLQNITEKDAIAEGVTGPRSYQHPAGGDPFDGYTVDGDSRVHPTARAAFASLWDTINRDRATWASNPWLWVVGFRRTKP